MIDLVVEMLLVKSPDAENILFLSIICLVSSFEMLLSYVEDIPEQVHGILKEASKPTTVIYNSPRNFASNLIAEDQTIAIRMVNSGFSHELIKKFGKPITKNMLLEWSRVA